MRKQLIILFIIFFNTLNAQLADSLVVRLNNIEGDSLRYEFLNNIKHNHEIGKDISFKLFDTLINYAHKINDSLLIAKLQVERGGAAIENNKLVLGRAIINKIIIPKNKSTIYDMILCDKYIYLAFSYYQVSDYKKAVFYNQKALEIAKKNQLLKIIIKINNNNAVILRKNKEFKEAIKYFKRNVLLGKLLNSENIITKSNFNLALTYIYIHKNDSAKYYLLKVDTTKINKPELLSEVYHNYAKVLLNSVSTDSIVKLLNKSLFMNHDNYLAYFTLGTVYQNQRKFKKAKKNYFRCIKIARNRKEYEYIQKSNFQLGLIYNKLKKYKLANRYLTSAKRIKDSINNSNNEKEIKKLMLNFEVKLKNEKIAMQKQELLRRERSIANKNAVIISFGILIILLMIFSHLYFYRQKTKHKASLITNAKYERNIIANDLQESLGSRITYIISSIDTILYAPQSKEDIIKQIGKIKNFSLQTIDLFRDALWALNKDYFTIQEIQQRNMMFVNKVILNNKHIKFEINSENKSDRILHSRASLVILRTIQKIILSIIEDTNSDKITLSYFETEKYSWIIIVGSGDFTTDFMQSKSTKRTIKNIQEIGCKAIFSNSRIELKIIIPYKNMKKNSLEK